MIVAAGSTARERRAAQLLAARCDGRARIDSASAAITPCWPTHDHCTGCRFVAAMTVHTGPSPLPTCGLLRSCTVCGASYRTDFARCPVDGGPIETVTGDPLIGATIANHYVIEGLVGAGAMGRVYRAHHSRLVNKQCAVKILFGDLAASPAARMRFAHEAESASLLDHPNIIGVSDFGRTDTGLMYLVMELVDGQSLGRLLLRGPIAPARVSRIARQLCEGLAHAHAHGLVHRDFKPDNIMVIGEPGAETVLIGDFGLAISTTDDDARLTTSGVLCTPAYAAPEQLLGHAIDHRADLYALGVTLYEMLTGRLPFSGDAPEILAWKVSGKAPELASVPAGVPPTLLSVVAWLLARDPNARPATARAVLDALDGVALAPTITVRAPGHRTARRFALAGLLAVSGAAVPASFAITSASASVPSLAVRSEELVDLPAVRTVAHETVTALPVPVDVLPEPVPVMPEPVARAPVLPRARPRARAIAPPQPEAPRARAIAPPHAVASEPPPQPPAEVVVRDVSHAAVQSAHPIEPAPAAAPVRAAAPPPRAPTVRRLRPRPRIVALDVSGSLPSSVVERAVVRVMPGLAACAQTIGPRVVAARFEIDETRRATRVRGASCLAAALTELRSEAAPDVGNVSVELRLDFGDEHRP